MCINFKTVSNLIEKQALWKFTLHYWLISVDVFSLIHIDARTKLHDS